MNAYQSFRLRCRVIGACLKSLAGRASVAGNHLVAFQARSYAAHCDFPSHYLENELRKCYHDLRAKL